MYVWLVVSSCHKNGPVNLDMLVEFAHYDFGVLVVLIGIITIRDHLASMSTTASICSLISSFYSMTLML